MVEHRFGGVWTERKLAALRNYLIAYRHIFDKSPRAKLLKTVYVDAFAGTGDRAELPPESGQLDLSDGEQIERIKAGSARIALELPTPFDRYIFIEKKESHAECLKSTIAADYPALVSRCKVHRADAMVVLRELATFEKWDSQRAVVFLDPYGMSVDWVTITMLAQTRAVDLWVLLPLGTGVMRLLTRRRLPPAAWSSRLDLFFGDRGWRERFYVHQPPHDLFGNKSDPSFEKVATFESIGAYFLERLATVFEGVAPNAMPLINNRGNPLFLLCFAAANKKGAPIAIKIAEHLLKG